MSVSQHARKYNLQACVRWLKDGSSNMAVLEFHLLTGFEADLESLERVRVYWTVHTIDSTIVNHVRYYWPAKDAVCT